MPNKSGEIKTNINRGGWFRLYANILNDPKVQLLPDRLFKFWINCLAITSDQRGYLPAPREIAFRLRLSLTEVEDDLAILMTHGLVDAVTVDGKTQLQPHNWFAWQPPSYYSTERVRKWRRNKRETKRNGDVTADETNETYSTSTVTEGNTSARDALWPSTARETPAKVHPGKNLAGREVLP
jgi:hypothetical protein